MSKMFLGWDRSKKVVYKITIKKKRAIIDFIGKNPNVYICRAHMSEKKLDFILENVLRPAGYSVKIVDLSKHKGSENATKQYFVLLIDGRYKIVQRHELPLGGDMFDKTLRLGKLMFENKDTALNYIQMHMPEVPLYDKKLKTLYVDVINQTYYIADVNQKDTSVNTKVIPIEFYTVEGVTNFVEQCLPRYTYKYPGETVPKDVLADFRHTSLAEITKEPISRDKYPVETVPNDVLANFGHTSSVEVKKELKTGKAKKVTDINDSESIKKLLQLEHKKCEESAHHKINPPNVGQTKINTSNKNSNNKEVIPEENTSQIELNTSSEESKPVVKANIGILDRLRGIEMEASNDEPSNKETIEEENNCELEENTISQDTDSKDKYRILYDKKNKFCKIVESCNIPPDILSSPIGYSNQEVTVLSEQFKSKLDASIFISQKYTNAKMKVKKKYLIAVDRISDNYVIFKKNNYNQNIVKNAITLKALPNEYSFFCEAVWKAKLDRKTFLVLDKWLAANDSDNIEDIINSQETDYDLLKNLNPDELCKIFNSKEEGAAFTDGSYSPINEKMSYACVFFFNGKLYKEANEITIYDTLSSNEAEIHAVMKAITIAHLHKCKKLHIYYDCNAVVEAITSNNTKYNDYRNFMTDYNSKMELEFHKVEAHSGVCVNKLCDQFAKEISSTKQEVNTNDSTSSNDLGDTGNSSNISDTSNIETSNPSESDGP